MNLQQNMNRLPVELILYTCEYMDIKSIHSLRSTSRQMYQSLPNYKEMIKGVLSECKSALEIAPHYSKRLALISNKSSDYIREFIINQILIALFPLSWHTLDINGTRDIVDVVYDRYVEFELLYVFDEQGLLKICYEDVYREGIRVIQKIMNKEFRNTDFTILYVLLPLLFF